MGDRNEVLANFQALSGIEDIAICLDVLEQKGWDLTAAVNSVLPDDNYSSASASVPPLQPRGGYVDLTSSSNGSATSHPHSVDLTRDPLPSHHAAAINLTMPSVTTRERSLGVYYDRSLISLHLPTTTTIAQLKQRLEEETGVPPAQQSITGWPHPPHSDLTRLCDMNIPDSVFHVRLENQPLLEQRPGPTHHHDYGEDDNSVDIDGLEATLTSRRINPQPAPDPPITVESSPSSSTYGDACEQLTNSEEEGEGEGVSGMDSLAFDEDIPSDESQRAMREPLIPDGCSDPSEALQHFTEKFEQRYGVVHPLFYVGSLKDAVREATTGLHRKPMLVYLHHDASILSNVFCSQLLCSESVVSYLTNNYTTWAWDLTSPQHRKQLLDMISECFGQMARANVDDIHSDHLPVILIVFKVQGSVNVRNIIQGETNLDSLMTSLITAMEEHIVHLEMEMKEERERLARVQMIAEQNAEYQESLQADQQKVKRKEEQQRVEEEERQEKEAIRQSMASVLPDEPAAACAEKTSTLRIRLPDGSTAQRRFLARDTLQDLLHYFGSIDYPVQDFKVLRSFPRTDLSALEPSLSLEAAGLCPQDTLFLEER